MNCHVDEGQKHQNPESAWELVQKYKQYADAQRAQSHAKVPDQNHGPAFGFGEAAHGVESGEEVADGHDDRYELTKTHIVGSGDVAHLRYKGVDAGELLHDRDFEGQKGSESN